MAGSDSRPFGVTLVFLVILLSGLVAIVAGIVRLFTRGDADNNVTLVAALVTILIGLIYLMVAKGIASGSRGARFVVAIVTIVTIGMAVWMLIGSPGLWVSLVAQIVLGFIVLALLYSARSRQFFGS